MEFSIKTGFTEKQVHDCVVVGVFEQGALSAAAHAFDEISGGFLSKIVAQGDMEGKVGSTLMLHHVTNVESARVLLVGLGAQAEFTEKQYLKAVRAAIKALSGLALPQVACYLADLAVTTQATHWKVAQLVQTMLDEAYCFEAIKAQKNTPKIKIEQMHICLSHAQEASEANAGLKEGAALSAGVSLTKDLGNLPPNVCTPSYLAEQATHLAKQYGLSIEVLERQDLEVLGMGSFLGVTKGSDEPPKFIVLQHLKGQTNARPVVLVGKGITFDTGGISLKPGAEMDEMKYDMCGAASVLGTFKAVAELDLPIHLVGLIPTCENMPSGKATRPGDVLTSMSGLTIEVLNTDAEGRLILCDALTYAERFNPCAVIDIATLTGACVIALGSHASGLYSNQDALAHALLQAGESAMDRAWHMPMWDDYQNQLDSNFADMANIGGRAGGSITAACFLSRFAKNYHWAHLDIAGTAWKSGKEKGGTGRPVPLLVTYLKLQAKQAD